ncbi:MAG: TIGR02147 family protein [Bdellovibrionota bacterium]
MAEKKQTEERAESSKTKNTLDIYGYTDYRCFLRDFYESRKSSQRGYSYRSFSKTAGFSSPNFLKLVIDGKRNISQETIEKFIKALGLQNKRAEYFRVLVNMNQSKSDNEKEIFFYQLRSMTPKAKRRELNLESLQYLSNWLYPVIREMISLGEFREDPHWIARRVTADISPNDVESAMRFLIKEKFIEKDRDSGKWTAKEDMVLSSDEVRSLAIRNYHRQMIERAKETLEGLDLKEREFGAVTFVMPESLIDELKNKLKTFRSELHAWSVQACEDQPSDVVIQVNFQMFPHTKKL